MASTKSRNALTFILPSLSLPSFGSDPSIFILNKTPLPRFHSSSSPMAYPVSRANASPVASRSHFVNTGILGNVNFPVYCIPFSEPLLSPTSSKSSRHKFSTGILRACSAENSRAFSKPLHSLKNVTFRKNVSTSRIRAVDAPQNVSISTNDKSSPDAKVKNEERSAILMEEDKPEELGLLDSVPPGGITLTFACLVGLLGGGGVVLFNDTVHLIHDFAWTGVPESGATWIRTQPLESTWQQLFFIPIGGGLVVGGLNALRTSLEVKKSSSEAGFLDGVRAFFQPVLKALAAAVTLGTGNSLGPEGPSVEIGASVAKGVGSVLKNSRERKTAMLAAGSAAGISSGFNAAVSGCFFAVENVLRSSSASSDSLTTAMILLSSVLASVVSQAGLGSDPAFSVPAYEFKSPAELPLYLLLGVLSGGVSIALTKGSAYATKGFEMLQKKANIPTILLPSIGGLCVGVISLMYPEILYWGFENVNELLESRPLVYAPPAALLVQLVGAKVVATALCRGSGLVGGVYAPSLFIGAALGSAYGRLVVNALALGGPTSPFTWMSVAAPQAYALVGMAAVLAGVCQVPLTSVLLLFELTRDYRIILPLMAAVGLSSWIASSANKKPSKSQNALSSSAKPQLSNQVESKPDPVPVAAIISSENGGRVLASGSEKSKTLGNNPKRLDRSNGLSATLATSSVSVEGYSDADKLAVLSAREFCYVDDSLCLVNSEEAESQLMDEIAVKDAMRSHFASVQESGVVKDALAEMTAKQEWCCIVVGEKRELKGLITLVDVQQEIQQVMQAAPGDRVTEIVHSLPVADMCNRKKDSKLITVKPHVSLRSAERLMTPRGLRQLPVVEVIEPTSEDQPRVKIVVGLIDRESISLACRVELTKRLLNYVSEN